MFVRKPVSRLCPLVRRPTGDCYCSILSSSTVEAAISFCMGDFSRCEIYRKQMN